MKYNFEFIDNILRKETEKESSVERLRKEKLSFVDCPNALILPSKDIWVDGKCLGGVVDKEGNFIMSSAWHEGKRCDKYDYDDKDVKDTDDSVVYIGFLNSCWGHAITDNLKKVWFLHTETCKELLNVGYKIVYITADNTPMPIYVWRLFEMCGIDHSSFIHVTNLTRYKHVVVPDNSFIADNGERFYTNEFVKTIESIKNTVIPLNKFQGKKIYFTRSGTQSRREVGERSIEKVFQSLGYIIIHPEAYSVDKQVAMLKYCSAFAATEGSISHNAVFCSPETSVTIIRKVYDVNKYQMAINSIAKVNVTYVDAHKSYKAPAESPWAGPFFMYINDNVRRFSKKRSFTFPLWMNPLWWRYKFIDNVLLIRLENKINRFFKL